MVATNQITGSGDLTELLNALTDEQLDEQITHYREMLDGTSGFGHWKINNLLSAACSVRHDRSLSRSSGPA